MKKKKFGIISGAGPMAGALLYQLIIEDLQAKGLWRDADFPEILIYNVPFTEMLLGETNNLTVRSELITALQFISPHVDFVYIACQTLHIFLNENELKQSKVVSLLELTKAAVKDTDNLVVVGSKTSSAFDLHTKQLGRACPYVETERSEQTIDAILQGKTPDLIWLNQLAAKHNVILGCTEFSVVTQKSTLPFIDPIKLAATDIVSRYLNQ